MNVEARIRTKAEQAIADRFAAVRGKLSGGAAVLRERDAAFALFERNGLPTRRVEAWKYTDLRALMKAAAPPAERPGVEAAERALSSLRRSAAPGGAYRLVLVDGFFFTGLSDVAALREAGVAVEPVCEALASPPAELFDLPELAAGDIGIALNTAFFTDGVLITIGGRTSIDEPLEILHISSGVVAGAARNVVEIGREASVRIVESHHGPDDVGSQSNVLTVIRAGASSKVAWARVQGEGDRALHIGTTILSVGPKARVSHLTLTAGADVSRSQLFMTTGGEGTDVALYGAGMIRRRQHADVSLTIDHALPGAKTRVTFKSAVDNEAEGIFQGKIIVRPDAQKTDAKMVTQSLLLSEISQFTSKPELEIFADDVQCGHGATTGRIDANMLFYLMARGIPRSMAEQMLIEAFLVDAIEAFGDEAIGGALKGTVSAWLAAREAKEAA
jgi:Fe-S cluster assembly protein SufD